jgi:hypothetical protein
MSTRALLLADALTNRHGIESFEGDAANELRRLHEENELLARACDKIRVMHREEIKPLLDVHSLNLELLEALKQISAIEDLEWGGDWEEIEQAREIANAAIAKAEGKE